MRHEEHKMQVYDQLADMLEPHMQPHAGTLPSCIVEAVELLLSQHLKQSPVSLPELTVDRIDAIADLCQQYNPTTAPGRFVHGLEALWRYWGGSPKHQPGLGAKIKSAAVLPESCPSCRSVVAGASHFNEEGVCIHSATFGQRLQQERFAHGYTQDQLASKLSVKPLILGQYESNKTMPDTLVISQLKALGFDVAYLITGNRRLGSE